MEPQIENTNHYDDTPEKKLNFGKRATNFFINGKDSKEFSDTASPGKGGAIMDSIDALWGSTGGQSQEIAKQANEKDDRLFERRGAEQRNAQLDKDIQSSTAENTEISSREDPQKIYEKISEDVLSTLVDEMNAGIY